ncbi:MAG: DUF1467 family protein [Bauldia sp.]|nr:DUF1467 family protein [Bauldia sp.]
MNFASVIAVYFVVWWIVLFAVLPWGMRTQEEEGEVILGTVPSAPHNPKLVQKAIATSIVAAIVTFGIWYGVDQLGWGVEELGELFLPKQ